MSLVKSPLTKKTDQEFKPYVKQFEMYYNNTVKTPIVFGDKFEKSVVGVCITYSKHVKIIKINPRFWNKADDYEREALIFHELGHCELDKDHNDSLYEISEGHFIPASLMQSNLLDGNTYTTYHSYYMYELFKK